MSEMRSRRKRDVDIFNFSFLDILACVIGLLIFVLTIVVVCGNGSSPQAASRVNAADQNLSAARETAALSAARRARDEQILADRATAVVTQDQDRDMVQRQIVALRAETQEIESRAAAERASLNRLNEQPTPVPDALQLEALRTEAAVIQSHADAVQRKTNDITAGAVKTISYYIPRVQQSDRNTLWVEISGSRIWVIQSPDFIKTPIDFESDRYDRRDGVPGYGIGALTVGQGNLPRDITTAIPGDTVIEVALRSDGYAAYRTFREWAWKKGFAMNWVPVSSDSIVLTSVAHSIRQ